MKIIELYCRFDSEYELDLSTTCEAQLRSSSND